MAVSQRGKEGLMFIDDTAAGGVKAEFATFTCPHCEGVTPLDPLRQRPRGYCRKCDRYLCDRPACNGQCVPMEKVFDRVREAAARGLIIPSF